MPLAGSIKDLLVRGLIAGLIAGLLAGGVAFALGESHVQAAISIEEAEQTSLAHEDHSAAANSHSHQTDTAPLVDRSGQRAGLVLATTLAGLALGAIFALGATYARRFTKLSGPALVLSLAVLCWLAIEAVPFFKYPANPPAVGDPETLDKRTLLWLAAVILGLLAVAISVFAAKIVTKIPAMQRAETQYRGGRGLWTVRVACGVVTFIAVVTIGYLLLPTINEVGQDFPATLLWQFRVSSLATQVTLWLTLGLTFAALTQLAERSAHKSTPIAVEPIPLGGNVPT
ncbi:CbtA family protein [Rhodococcus sp. MS16]|uniref:CbtA family protein n=1 Tax=Rhodococcus sp. MS16 TaxID=2579941 RepID=UPI0015629458|nr:CbtA family protein [Rhodococcus sp. MS16]NRI69848.1 CbtA family protein [Rhodococcus sp. MS16]